MPLLKYKVVKIPRESHLQIHSSILLTILVLVLLAPSWILLLQAAVFFFFIQYSRAGYTYGEAF